ncbi:MAG TPA: gephyrin-like molybdotransferase Glp [Acetobacteraceae bacterium]
MLPVAEARARIIAGLRPTAAEVVALSDAWGRITATSILARLTQPPTAVSAMDGYALRASDGALGTRLRVAGRAPAGHPFTGQVGPGEAVRLYTGSGIPDGADCVVAQEDVTANDQTMRLNAAAEAGRHVRPAGGDFRQGAELVPAGTRLGARAIGLAAAGNHPWVTVHRRPRVGLLATGDEIAMPGDPLGPGSIVSSNVHALAALVRAGGGEPVMLPIARDTADAVAQAAQGAAGLDMLVTTGGASVGDYDLVQAGLARQGFVLDFWRIAMRPGKPLLSGELRGVPVLGLPGNPVSALVCAILFLWPALGRLSGMAGDPLPSAAMPLGRAVAENDHREDYLRSTIAAGPDGVDRATPFARQDSSLLHVLAQSQGLVIRPPHAPAAPAGTHVPVLRLEGLGL